MSFTGRLISFRGAGVPRLGKKGPDKHPDNGGTVQSRRRAPKASRKKIFFSSRRGESNCFTSAPLAEAFPFANHLRVTPTCANGLRPRISRLVRRVSASGFPDSGGPSRPRGSSGPCRGHAPERRAHAALTLIFRRKFSNGRSRSRSDSSARRGPRRRAGSVVKAAPGRGPFRRNRRAQRVHNRGTLTAIPSSTRCHRCAVLSASPPFRLPPRCRSSTRRLGPRTRVLT